MSNPSHASTSGGRPYHGREISRFTGNGKTFFFNEMKARNKNKYLAVNALYGQGRQERMILFEGHYLEFLRHLQEAIEELSGFSLGMGVPEETPKALDMKQSDGSVDALPMDCPECGYGDGAFELEIPLSGHIWWVKCCECGTTVFQNKEIE